MTTPKTPSTKKKLIKPTKPTRPTDDEILEHLITSIELHDTEQSKYLHDCVSLAIWLSMGSFAVSIGIAIIVALRLF